MSVIIILGWVGEIRRRQSYIKEAEKKRMLLSEETLLGLRMTGMHDYVDFTHIITLHCSQLICGASEILVFPAWDQTESPIIP